MLKDCCWRWSLWSSLIKIISKYQTSRSKRVCLRPAVLLRCHRDYDTHLGKESSLLTPERWAQGGFGHWLEGRVLLEVWFPSPFHHTGVILLLTQRSPVSSLCPADICQGNSIILLLWKDISQNWQPVLHLPNLLGAAAALWGMRGL